MPQQRCPHRFQFEVLKASFTCHLQHLQWVRPSHCMPLVGLSIEGLVGGLCPKLSPRMVLTAERDNTHPPFLLAKAMSNVLDKRTCCVPVFALSTHGTHRTLYGGKAAANQGYNQVLLHFAGMYVIDQSSKTAWDFKIASPNFSEPGHLFSVVQSFFNSIVMNESSSLHGIFHLAKLLVLVTCRAVNFNF